MRNKTAQEWLIVRDLATEPEKAEVLGTISLKEEQAEQLAKEWMNGATVKMVARLVSGSDGVFVQLVSIVTEPRAATPGYADHGVRLHSYEIGFSDGRAGREHRTVIGVDILDALTVARKGTYLGPGFMVSNVNDENRPTDVNMAQQHTPHLMTVAAVAEYARRIGYRIERVD